MAVFPEGIEVLPCSVSFVAGKIVTGVVLVVSIHDSIAGYFCTHRGGCNGKAQAVSPLYRLLGSYRGNRVYTVNQDILNRASEVLDRLGHCFQTGFEDVDKINFVMVDYAESYCERSAYNIGIGLLALGGRQLLGIINSGEDVVGWQDNSRGHHRTGQGTTANFIDAGNIVESSKVPADVLIDELFQEIDAWIAAGMQRPKRLKMANPAALAMAEASLIPLD